MKLRVTGILLGILVLALVIVPAFAAAAESSEVSEKSVEAVESVELVELMVPSQPPVEEKIEEPVSTSPYYLNEVQMKKLVYQEMEGIDYVTVESFITAMNPEAMVEEANGSLTASAATVTEIVEINDESGLVMANIEEETLLLTAKSGQRYIVANGRYLYVENHVLTIDGKIAVPVETLAKVFNLEHIDNVAEGRIELSTREGADAYLESGESYYNENTLYWLSRIIYSESGNQSLTGKLAVGNVVMNRLESPLFPNTIKGVLFQRNQFSPAMSGSIYRDPGSSSVIAAKLVMDGAVVLEDALFFNRAGMNTFAARNRVYVATIGAHAFYN